MSFDGEGVDVHNVAAHRHTGCYSRYLHISVLKDLTYVMAVVFPSMLGLVAIITSLIPSLSISVSQLFYSHLVRADSFNRVYHSVENVVSQYSGFADSTTIM